MKWSGLWWFGIMAAVLMLEEHWVGAAPSSLHANAVQELMKLDEMYSSIARPSVRSSTKLPDMGPKVQRAINMLRLQQLDHLYGDRARPRFGKRVAANTNYAPIDYEGQYPREDVGEWYPVRR